MKYYHNIELQNSKITGLIADPLASDPSFSANEAGRIYFNVGTKTLRLNDGQEYIDINIPANFNNLIEVLGTNWINSDYTFNPTPFNEFHNVSDLDSNSSLFDVLKQFDDAMGAPPSITTLQDVSTPEGSIAAGSVIYYTGDNFTFADIDTLIENYGNLNFETLKDVDASNLEDGDIFFYDGGSQTYKPGSLVYFFEDLQATTGHTITHNLGVQYFPVTVVNRFTDSIITDAVVTFTNENQLDITLSAPTPISVIIITKPNLSI